MTAALGLPVALVLGALAGLVSGAVRRILGRERSWWAGWQALGTDARLLLRGGKERATALELGGALASFLGTGIAAGAALGEIPGSAVLLYLSLLVAAAGGHIAALDASTPLREELVARGRSAWVLAEPGFVVALGGALARWRAADLDAARGAQDVLGHGPTVGPAIAAVGLVVAVAMLLVTGALRMVPPSEGIRSTGRRAGGALLITLCRWSLAGATALVGAVLLVGGELRAATGALAAPEDLLLPGLAALGAALLIGIAEGVVSGLRRARAWVAIAALVVGAGAAVAVVVA
jgi:hypothetical protein